jgi:hypothetical protein
MKNILKFNILKKSTNYSSVLIRTLVPGINYSMQLFITMKKTTYDRNELS